MTRRAGNRSENLPAMAHEGWCPHSKENISPRDPFMKKREDFMAHRIICGARPHTPADDHPTRRRSLRARMVIADWGTTAEVLVFPANEPIKRGARFQYCGTLWVITGSRRDSRVLVAEPLSH